MRLSLPLHSYELRSDQASTSRLLNCFVEELPENARSPLLLTRAPGTTPFVTVGTGPIQAVHRVHGSTGPIYVVSGGALYSVTSAGTVTLLGVVGSSDQMDIASNDTSVVVVNPDTGNAYHWTSPTFAQITDADFLSSGDVEFVDNYLVFRERDSGVFFCADLGSATSFDALNFATAESHPDNLVGIKADHRQLILFGENSIEIWENTGQSGFPFERIINGVIELGCLNGRTVEKLDNSVIWVANDYTIRRLNGMTPDRISTHAIEQWLRDVDMDTGRAWSYTYDGHLFYVLTFTATASSIPRTNTKVYDATTGLWHERETYGSDYWEWGFPTVMSWGGMIVGNLTDNRLSYLDPSIYAEDGETQRMEWVYQPVYAEGRRAFHDKLEMIFERGVGLTSGQGSDPEVMLDMSDDGGRTWLALPNQPMGQIGEYSQRCSWSALGSSDQRVYRAAVSDPVKVTLLDTQLQVRGGRI